MSEKIEKAAGPQQEAVDHPLSLLADDDLYLFNEGSHCGLHQKPGARLPDEQGVQGSYFAVWAPNAGESL